MARRADYEIRAIRVEDNGAVAQLIRTVMPEFGAQGPGFAIIDPEVDDMFTAYAADGARAGYWVVVARGNDAGVVGGGGFAPLLGGGESTCELRKMHFFPELRGLGLGQELLRLCMERARSAGFSRMYLETLSKMAQARALYERHGFARLPGPLGNTGHYRCDLHYAKDLGGENGR